MNIGWNANFIVLLDSDSAGLESGENYKENFNLSKEIIFLPGTNTKIENCFTGEEKNKLYKLAFEKELTDRMKKKEFSSTFALLNEKDGVLEKLKKIITKETKDTFKNIFEALN